MAITLLDDKVYINDIGTSFRATIKEDDVAVPINDATTKEFVFQPPDGISITKTASFYTDGSDGIIQYLTVDGDMNVSGLWKLQARIVTPTWNGRSDMVEFKVFDNLT